MPRFTVDLTDAAVAALQTVVTAYNENNGAALTVQQWILLHLREIAIQDQLVAAATSLKQQAEADANAAFAAERQRLIESVS